MPDYSCYITVVNKLDVALTLVSSGTGHGYWNVNPPQTINANSSSSQFQTKDSWGAEGSDGWVNYRAELVDVKNDSQKPVITISFNDPTGNNDNTFGMSANTASSLFSFSNTDYPKRDHPLTVTATVDYNRAMTSSSAVTSVKIPSPQLNVYNSKNELHKQNNMEIWNSTNPTTFEDNNTTGLAGSFYPVSVDLTQTSYLNMVLNVDSNLVGVPFYITGSLGADTNVLFNSDPQLFTSTGTQTISMTVQPNWSTQTFPWGIAGNVVWSVLISPTNQVIQINSSRLEVYSLTKTLLKFFNNRISVGALRAFILPAHASGETDWVTYVIKAAFGSFGFVYETNAGAPAFGCTGSGGNYKLSSWVSLVGTGSDVNCYDQAGIVQIGLGLGLNGASQWDYMKPFGYINTTNLIGVGSCNNPFYTYNNTTAVIANNDAKRTGFGNHAFIAVTSKSSYIADACSGPHVASESLNDYIDAAIEKSGNTDTTTTLYSSNPGMGPGTSANVQQKAGVTSIDGNSTSSTTATDKAMAMPAAASLQAVMDRARVTGNSAPAITFTNVDLAKVHDFLTQTNTPLLYHSNDVSASGSHLTWVLKSAVKLTKVEIVVLSSSDEAKDYFLNHLTGYQRPLDEILVSAPGSIAKGEICLVSPPEHQNYGRMVWVRGNVFAHVVGPMAVTDLDKMYLKAVDTVFMDGAKRNTPGQELIQMKPVVRSINAPQKVKVGEVFTVYASVDGSVRSRVYNGENDTIVFLSANTAMQSFQFRAEKAGKEKLLFAFAQTVTGMVVTKEVEIVAVNV